jgi:hypothetical protein
MKKLALLSIFAVLASSVAIFTPLQASNPKATPSAAYWQDRDEALACSNESLEGVYGLTISGTRPAPAPPVGTPNYVPGTIEQLIGVGTRTFNGDGNFSQGTNEKGSLSGILFPNRTLQGTYSITSDCSGTLTLNIPGLPFPILYDIVVVSHGKAFHSIVASPQPVMVSTDGQKVN